jgi:hypothetical protein
MTPEETAEKLAGLRKTKADPVIVEEPYGCPFRNKHDGIAPSEDYCLAAHIIDERTQEEKKRDKIRRPWRELPGKGLKLYCPERTDYCGIPEECPIRTGKLRVEVRET